MNSIKFKQIKHRQDYLSVNKSTAISAYVEIFTIGDLVEHDDEEAGLIDVKEVGFLNRSTYV